MTPCGEQVICSASVIEARRVSKSFGAINAVTDVTFSVAAGEIVGFLGPNGAGKTTTLRMLAGIFPPTSGEVRVAGHDPLAEPMAVRRAVGYFPEYAPFYPDLSVAEYLRFVARLKRVPRGERKRAVEEVLERCGLGHVACRRVGKLSKGYRQRVGLAQALLGNPAVLLLDEPTIGLDPEQVVEIRSLIGSLRGSRTVLLSTHILSEVEAMCERVVVISHGRVVAEGTPEELNARVGGGYRVVVRLEAPAAAAAVGAMSEVGEAEVRVIAADSGTVTLVVESSVERELDRAVSRVAARNGWTIVELRRETLELEDIFLRLVRPSG